MKFRKDKTIMHIGKHVQIAAIIGISSHNLYKQIATKYFLHRKSANLPALIFLRFFGTSIVNKITNIYHTELINNHFGLQLNFYLRIISQLNQILSHYYQSQKLPFHISNPPIPFLLKMGEVELHRRRIRILGIASLISPNPSLRKREIDYLSFLKSSSLITPLLKRDEGGLFAAINGANVAKGIIQLPYLSLRGEAEAIKKIGTSSTISKDDKRRAWNDGLIIFSRQNQNVFFRRKLYKYLQTTGEDISTGIILNTQRLNNPALNIGSGYHVADNSSQNTSSIRQEKTLDFSNNMRQKHLSGMADSLMYKNKIALFPFVMTKGNIPLTETTITNNSTNLILRKPVTQQTDVISETKKNLQTYETNSTKLKDSMIREISKEKSAHEINMIADKVYMILEKRIYIEKERRGWR